MIVEYVLLGFYAVGVVASWLPLARFFFRDLGRSDEAAFFATLASLIWPIIAIAWLGSKVVEADDRRTNPERIEAESLRRMAEFEEALRERERNIERLERELGIGR